jgi:hypothetical protein
MQDGYGFHDKPTSIAININAFVYPESFVLKRRKGIE